MKLVSLALTATCAVQRLITADAFSPAASSTAAFSTKNSLLMAHSEGRISRRNVLKNLSIASIGFVVTTTSIADPANASGGATAGGVYLLSAKQRYNERVKAGVKEFIALSTSLEAGSLDATKDFFAKDAVGGWKDASSAGYLLSNAFRRSSTTPPDSLPTVKKWKAFAAELEVLQKALKKKDSKGALASYQKSEALLDAYLESVELPPVIEMRQ